MLKSKTLIFAPAPLKTALKSIERTAWSGFKSGLMRNSQVIKSAITGSVEFTDYHHVSRMNVNRGDIAISVAIDRQVSRVVPSADVMSLGWDDVPPRDIYENIKDFSRVVIGGGGYIFLDSSGKLNSRSLDLDVFEKFQGDVIAHGIGLNRLLFEDPWTDFRQLPAATKEWLRRFAGRCKHISVRDQPTADLFAEGAGVEVEVVGDPALSLGVGSGADENQRETKVVGINTASHGRRALVCLRSLMPNLEQSYRALVRQGFELKYFVHDDADYSIIRYLKLRGHVFEVIDGPLETLIDEYKKCSFVINQMLHSSILAFSVGVPCIGIAYDLKSIAFFNQFDFDAYCLRWNQVDSTLLPNKIEAMREDRDLYAKAIRQKTAALVTMQNAFIQKALA